MKRRTFSAPAQAEPAKIATSIYIDGEFLIQLLTLAATSPKTAKSDAENFSLLAKRLKAEVRHAHH